MALGSLVLAVLAPVAAPWVWPLDPAPPVVRGFEPPPVAWAPGHRGVDLGGSSAQSVRAAGRGRVSFAGVVAGTPVVVVDHGETRTTYEPVIASVSVGAEVAAGDVIGQLQPADSHCFPDACLHWGLVTNADDSYRDPLALLGDRRIRLLPWDEAG